MWGGGGTCTIVIYMTEKKLNVLPNSVTQTLNKIVIFLKNIKCQVRNVQFRGQKSTIGILCVIFMIKMSEFYLIACIVTKYIFIIC